MGIKRRKAVILVKSEVTYALDPVPTGVANAIQVRNVDFTPLVQDLVQRELVRPWLGNAENFIGSQRCQIDFEVEMAGAGTSAITPPKWGPLLLACGFAQTINAGDVSYAPVSAGDGSATIYFHRDGKLAKLTGCKGTVDLGINAKGVPVMKFSFLGLYTPQTDVVDATPTFTGFQKPLISNTTNTPTFTMHGVSPIVKAFSVALGNKRVHRELIGYNRIDFTDRAPSGSITIEDALVATKAWVDTAAQGTVAALSIVQGTAAFNKVQIDIGELQLTNPKESDDEGVNMLTFGLIVGTGAAGNQDVIIKTS